MTAEELEELLKKHMGGHMQLVSRGRKAALYYRNRNDILREKSPENQSRAVEGMHPLRNADNRISHNWHNLLVNQKAGYLFTNPPAFDLGEESRNRKLRKVLGEDFARVCKDLCIEASNTGIAFLHIWEGEAGTLEMDTVSGMEVIPLFDRGMRRKMIGAIRLYQGEIDGRRVDFYEYWDGESGTFFVRKSGRLEPYPMVENRNEVRHPFGQVPFIPFANNNLMSSDLENVKPLIDVYDKIFSGYVNDIEDIQQVIFILTNYGGENLEEFLSDLKRYKTVDMQQSGEGDHSGISTLTIDIPVAARNDLLAMTRKEIFVCGQGVDPEKEAFQSASGTALRHVYSLLELKAGLMETEFRRGFHQLIRLILAYWGEGEEEVSINQSYFRSAIQNDLEQAQILSYVKDISSPETIAKSNPMVDDWQQEMRQLRKQKKENQKNKEQER